MCANIRSLAIELSWVVVIEKHVEQCFIAHHLWVISDPDHLSMTGAICTNLLIGRVVNLATSIANGSLGNTV